MQTSDILNLLVHDIHSVVVATTNQYNLPQTRVIDLMLYDNKGIYFLTAKGKSFYHQLMSKNYLALSGMCGGEATLAKKAVSLSGAVRHCGTENLSEIFEHNPYMAEIYPTAASRKALEVFCIYKAQGEYFDLSTKPISRYAFVIGDEEIQQSGYRITNNCTACGHCLLVCPVNCIEKGLPYSISQQHCLHCGNCKNVCTHNAVEKY